ncbi:uncharacterized protein [Palaemon carinicauda]|uniref:uncharacterized protein isoform X2 n=1 Tax=Palaemon carinicauda TaxID=392227 RepID=UPI0035B69CB4
MEMQSAQTAATNGPFTSQPSLPLQTPQPTTPSLDINEFDESCLRIWKVFREATEPLFFNILCWIAPEWDQNTNFKNYLIDKGVSIGQIKKSLNKSQLQKLMNTSPQDKWDITLIYVLLQLSGGLARKDDEKWSVKEGSDPELSITSLKNLRNETAHNLDIDKQKCSDIINSICELTRNIRESLKRIVLSDALSSECKVKIERDMDTIFISTQQRIDEIARGAIGAEAFEQYEREINFLKMMKLVKDKGLPFLMHYLEKSKSIFPFHLITSTSSNIKIPVEKVFTKMKLEGESNTPIVPLEDILSHVPHSDACHLLLIKGLAGMGKTTLVKKIISDWLSKTGNITGLNDFDLLLHVECRDYIESFKDLLVRSLGDVHQSFKDNELTDVCLALKCLVIIDGYDELNCKSSKLFQDILTLKKSRSLSVIVTTRPEFVEKFNKQVKSDYITVSTIQLEGIPQEKVEEFVCKYYKGLESDVSPSQSIDELLQYLRKTMSIMSEVWGLPLNLSIVTILWMNRPDVISFITTEAELYWQIFLLSVSKLEGRLEKNQLTSHIAPSALKNKIKQFLKQLCWESLKALKNDNINLPESTINDLADFCHSLGVPAEELTGAFLKKVTTSLDSSQYSFPHKGTLEFMGAYYIYMEMTDQGCNQLYQPTWAEELKKIAIPPEILTTMLNAVKSKPKDMATVTNIFERLYGGCLPENLCKYQNLLIQTISIFHLGDVDGTKVSEEIKIETLELLERSGVNDKQSMLKVLKNIKCNSSLTSWIAQRFNLFDKNTVISDSTIDAYISLLTTMDPPLPNKNSINIDIDLHDPPTGLEVLSRHLSRHNLNPRQLVLKSHFEGVSSPNREDIESIKSLLSNDCELYWGFWSTTFKEISPDMEDLQVRLPDQPSLDTFCELLAETKRIVSLNPSLKSCFLGVP